MLLPAIPLPIKFYEGIEQFNRQEFFKAHETLESVWKDRKTSDRTFIQGIIQIAVGCHHLRNGNIAGATLLFRRGLAKLESFKPCYDRVDVEKFVNSTSMLQLQVGSRVAGNRGAIKWPNVSIL